MVPRKYPAQIHNSVTVSHATSEALRANGFEAPGSVDGTMSLALLTAACSSMNQQQASRWCARRARHRDGESGHLQHEHEERLPIRVGFWNEELGQVPEGQISPSSMLARASPKRAARRGSA